MSFLEVDQSRVTKKGSKMKPSIHSKELQHVGFIHFDPHLIEIPLDRIEVEISKKTQVKVVPFQIFEIADDFCRHMNIGGY